MNDNNQGTCWALVHIPRNPQTLATPDRSQASDPGNVGSEGSAAPRPGRRGAEKRKRWAVCIQIGGQSVQCWVEIHNGRRLVIRKKHGSIIQTLELAELATREFQLKKGELCL